MILPQLSARFENCGGNFRFWDMDRNEHINDIVIQTQRKHLLTVHAGDHIVDQQVDEEPGPQG